MGVQTSVAARGGRLQRTLGRTSLPLTDMAAEMSCHALQRSTSSCCNLLQCAQRRLRPAAAARLQSATAATPSSSTTISALNSSLLAKQALVMGAASAVLGPNIMGKMQATVGCAVVGCMQ